jgi:hypothetical protein
LKLAGVDAGDAATRVHRGAGGVPRTRIFTRAFLALIGQWPWRRLAHVPVELILLPADGPFSVYDFACWARQTSVSLSVVESAPAVSVRARSTSSEIGGRRPTRGHAAAVTVQATRDRLSRSAGCESGRRQTGRGAGSSRRGSGRS